MTPYSHRNSNRPFRGSIRVLRGLLLPTLLFVVFASLGWAGMPDGDNPLGNLVVVSPASGPFVASPPKNWNDVPGLSTAVYTREGDNLKITVTAEIVASETVWLRALIDGDTASPSDVAYKLAGDSWDGVRSFNFIKHDVAQGRHIVRIQWIVVPGTTAQIGDRSLTVNSAAPNWGVGRLAVVAAPSSNWIVKTTQTWEDIPHLSTTLTVDRPRDVEISFSAESWVDSGRFFARAVVDGLSVGDVVFDSAASKSQTGTRSYTFVKKGLPVGTHTVKIQWLAEGAGARIRVGDRTLTAFSGIPAISGGAILSAAVEAAPVLFTSPSWVNVPDMTGLFTTDEPSTNVQITFSAETSVSSGRMFVRALVDGEYTQPSDVVFVAKGSAFRSQSFTFNQKNVLPGSHSVQIQAWVDPGATGRLADHSISVVFKRRHGVDFGQPYYQVRPRHDTFPLLVICFDPMYPGQIRPTKNQILNHVRGDDGGKSLRGWFHENTAGNYVPDSVTLIGCDDGAWFVAPPERRGDWYWNNGLYLMWQDAIKAGDPFIDFHAYDRDGDNHVSPQEVGVFILRPQNGPYGTFQPGTGFTVDGIAAPLSIAFLDLYFSAIESHRTWNVGLMAHEASHGLLGPMDMYTYGAYVSDPGYYSIMSSHALATHLDPFLKLKDGHLTPDLVEINGWETKTVKLKAVETSQEAVIIYDPAKKDREYFIVENRWSGAAAAANYDAGLPAKGIVVWHIVEDLALANMYRPLGTPSFVVEPWEWERLGVRLIGVLSRAGNSTTLKWADGSSSNIRITAMSVPNSEIYVEIAKLP